MRKAYTIQSGLVAILIYILIILIAVWAFVENKKETQFSGSNEQAIKVDMSAINSSSSSQSSKSNTQNQELTKEEKISQEPKKQVEEKTQEAPKKIQQEIVKPKEKSITDKKPVKEITKTNKDTTSLFDTIDAKAPSQVVKKTQTTTQKQTTSNLSSNSNTQVSKKASDLINGSPSAKSNGVEDGYKSKVKSILNGWPAQSDFAGNKAKIKFVIEPSGRFEFDVISISSNEEFNKGLIQYLKQLQKVGFGAHGGNRAYVFDVDFIAER